MARNAVQTHWGRTTAALALAAVVIATGALAAIAVVAPGAMREAAANGPDRTAAARLAASAAETEYLRARLARLDPTLAFDAEGASRVDAPASRFVERLHLASKGAYSPEAEDLLRSILAAFERWRSEQPLPEAYGAFSAALEEARAAEIERQFELLFDLMDRDAAQEAALRARDAERIALAARYASVAATTLVCVVVLALMRALFRPAPAAREPAALALLDEDARIVYADDKAIACAPAADDEDPLAALEAQPFRYRNGERKGETLIAGLESGDEFRLRDGRRMRVSRLATPSGGALLVMADVDPAAARAESLVA